MAIENKKIKDWLHKINWEFYWFFKNGKVDSYVKILPNNDFTKNNYITLFTPSQIEEAWYDIAFVWDITTKIIFDGSIYNALDIIYKDWKIWLKDTALPIEPWTIHYFNSIFSINYVYFRKQIMDFVASPEDYREAINSDDSVLEMLFNNKILTFKDVIKLWEVGIISEIVEEKLTKATLQNLSYQLSNPISEEKKLMPEIFLITPKDIDMLLFKGLINEERHKKLIKRIELRKNIIKKSKNLMRR